METPVRQAADDIRARLVPLGTEERAVQEMRYLKSDLDFLGVKVPEVRRTAKLWLRECAEIGREELVALTEELWDRRVHELRTFAIELSIFRFDLLRTDDLARLERWLREARTWAHVDVIAARLVGSLLARDPSVAATLDRWSEDDDFWLRRAAMLALLLELRRGGGDWKRFVRYADAMLEEKEFFIRKAIGWVLREVSKGRPDLVYRFVSSRIDRISGLTLREASRHLEPAWRDELKAAYRAR